MGEFKVGVVHGHQVVPWGWRLSCAGEDRGSGLKKVRLVSHTLVVLVHDACFDWSEVAVQTQIPFMGLGRLGLGHHVEGSAFASRVDGCLKYHERITDRNWLSPCAGFQPRDEVPMNEGNKVSKKIVPNRHHIPEKFIPPIQRLGAPLCNDRRWFVNVRWKARGLEVHNSTRPRLKPHLECNMGPLNAGLVLPNAQRPMPQIFMKAKTKTTHLQTACQKVTPTPL